MPCQPTVLTGGKYKIESGHVILFLHEPVKYLMDMSDRPPFRYVLIRQVFSPVRHV
jgi:hypothetical protein